ncbi:hypothetical protein [Streptomyces lydicus]|nr:hypothetical protein [Streptomyces lydicus]
MADQMLSVEARGMGASSTFSSLYLAGQFESRPTSETGLAPAAGLLID